MMDAEKIIRDYLPQVVHMSLATSKDNRPWVSELHFVYDERLNLYFISKASRRHSLEIALNPHVAGNIVTQHQVGDEVRGVYFEGRAEQLASVDEDHQAYQLYCQRFNADHRILEEARLPDGHKFYQIIVSTFYVFDSRESSPGQKYELAWNVDTAKKFLQA